MIWRRRRAFGQHSDPGPCARQMRWMGLALMSTAFAVMAEIYRLGGRVSLGERDAFSDVRSQRLDAKGAYLIVQVAVVTCLHEVRAPHTALRLAGPAHYLIGPRSSVLKRSISARQTCLCGALRSRVSVFRRRRSAGLSRMDISVRKRQMHASSLLTSRMFRAPPVRWTHVNRESA